MSTTENLETTEPTEPVETEQPAEQPAAEETPDTPKGANHEAAKYRRQLRAAETERDTLREQLAAVQRAEVERLAADHLADPGDVWAGTDLEPLLAEDGTVAPDKVRAAAQDLLGHKPHWRKPEPTRPQSLASGAAARSGGDERGWASALKRIQPE